MRIAVLGTYRSGSSAVAGVLHHLGVDLGGPFWQPVTPGAPPYYESAALADSLRRWWNEPDLHQTAPPAERVAFLSRWVEDRERDGAAHIGAKHPLLSLCGPDLLAGWGGATQFVWANRPLEEAIRALIGLGWWPGREEVVQSRLWGAAFRFLDGRPHLRVELADLTSQPAREVERIIHYLQITPDDEQIRSAVGSIQPRQKPQGA